MKKAERKSSKSPAKSVVTAQPEPFTPSDPEWPRVVATVVASGMSHPSPLIPPVNDDPCAVGILLTAEQVRHIENALCDIAFNAHAMSELAKDVAASGNGSAERFSIAIGSMSKVIGLKADTLYVMVSRDDPGLGVFDEEFRLITVPRNASSDERSPDSAASR